MSRLADQNRLPNCQNAVVRPEKLVRYLLNFDHPKGRAKAFFFSRFGYEIANFENLIQALLVLACAGIVTEIEESEFGRSYRVEGVLQTPDDRNPTINSIWMIDFGSKVPRFITAYPN